MSHIEYTERPSLHEIALAAQVGDLNSIHQRLADMPNFVGLVQRGDDVRAVFTVPSPRHDEMLRQRGVRTRDG